MPLTRRTVFGCKTETVQGTAVALVAADYLECEAIDMTPGADIITRNNLRASISPLEHITGKKWKELRIRTENKWSGVGGTPYAPLAALLQAAGLLQTVNAGVSVTYAPTSAAITNFNGPGKSITAECWLDGPSTAIKHVAKGGLVSSLRLSNQAGKLGMWEATLRGLRHGDPSDTAFPTTDFGDILPAILESATITIQADTVCIGNLEFGIENTISEIECANAEDGLNGFMLTERRVTLRIDPQILAVATHPFVKNFYDGASMAFSATWTIENGGSTPQKITLTAPRAQYTGMVPGDRNGIRIMQAEIALAASPDGDDEFSLVFEEA